MAQKQNACLIFSDIKRMTWAIYYISGWYIINTAINKFILNIHILSNPLYFYDDNCDLNQTFTFKTGTFGSGTTG